MEYKRKSVKLTWCNIKEIVNKIMEINSITTFSVNKEDGKIGTYSEYHDHFTFRIDDEIIIRKNEIYPSSKGDTYKYTAISLTTNVDWLTKLEECYNVEDWSIRSINGKKKLNVVTDKDTVSCDLESGIIVFDKFPYY